MVSRLVVDLGRHGVCLLGGLLQLGAELCDGAVLGAELRPQGRQLLLCLVELVLEIIVCLLEFVNPARSATQGFNLLVGFVLCCPKKAQLLLVLPDIGAQLLHKRAVFVIRACKVLALFYQLRNLLILFGQLLLGAPCWRSQGSLPGGIRGLPCKKLKLGLESIYTLHVAVNFLLMLQLGVFEGLVGIRHGLLVGSVFGSRLRFRWWDGLRGCNGWCRDFRGRCYRRRHVC